MENSHKHQCLSPRFYSTFSADSPASNVDTSGGETDGDTQADGDTEHEDEVEVAAPEISPDHQVILYAQVVLKEKIANPHYY